MSAPPLSQAAIDDMSADELRTRRDEISRWRAAGAVDGRPAPTLERHAGHAFTLAEVDGMTVEEFEANEPAIIGQLRSGQLSRPPAVVKRSVVQLAPGP